MKLVKKGLLLLAPLSFVGCSQFGPAGAQFGNTILDIVKILCDVVGILELGCKIVKGVIGF